MTTEKTRSTFWFAEKTKAALVRASERYGLTQTAILEMLVLLLDGGTLTIENGEAVPRRRGKSGKGGDA